MTRGYIQEAVRMRLRHIADFVDGVEWLLLDAE
jgi:hypothetical protein